MQRTRLAALAAAAAAVVAAIVVVSLVSPRGAATPSPSPTASASAATASPTPSASASASVTASAASAPPSSASGRFASTLGYSLELPAPWHKSSCSVLTQQSGEPMGEVFVPVAVRDERGTDIGEPYSTLRVFAEPNPQNITPRQWAEQGKTIGGTAR